MRKTIIKICEAIITKLDPIRVASCRITTKEAAMSLTGYLPPNKWTHASFTLSTWLKNNVIDTEASFAEVTLAVDGEVKEKTLAHMRLENGTGVTIGIGN